MKTKLSAILYLTLLLSVIKAQPILQGYYVYNAEGYNTPRVVVLEIHNSKFYLHEFPMDVAGRLDSQTGSFTITGALINLNPDTSMSISLNTGSLLSMSINCAPMRTIEIINSKKLVVTYKRRDWLMNEHTFDLGLSFTPDLNTTIKPFGTSLDWIKKYFNFRPREGIRICVD